MRKDNLKHKDITHPSVLFLPPLRSVMPVPSAPFAAVNSGKQVSSSCVCTDPVAVLPAHCSLIVTLLISHNTRCCTLSGGPPAPFSAEKSEHESVRLTSISVNKENRLSLTWAVMRLVISACVCKRKEVLFSFSRSVIYHYTHKHTHKQPIIEVYGCSCTTWASGLIFSDRRQTSKPGVYLNRAENTTQLDLTRCCCKYMKHPLWCPTLKFEHCLCGSPEKRKQ